MFSLRTPAALAPGKEPILKMVYVRGRDLKSGHRHDAVWEDVVDASYVLSTPAGAVDDMGRR